MWHSNRWMVAVLIITVLLLAACAHAPASGANSATSEPAKVERLQGTGLNRVILTTESAKRLGIQTTTVRDEQVSGNQRKVIPYSAVFYDQRGTTWVYTNPTPLTFVRNRVSIDSINGDQAILSEGPPSGTEVVTVGAPELYGTEFEGGLEP